MEFVHAQALKPVVNVCKCGNQNSKKPISTCSLKTIYIYNLILVLWISRPNLKVKKQRIHYTFLGNSQLFVVPPKLTEVYTNL